MIGTEHRVFRSKYGMSPREFQMRQATVRRAGTPGVP